MRRLNTYSNETEVMELLLNVLLEEVSASGENYADQFDDTVCFYDNVNDTYIDLASIKEIIQQMKTRDEYDEEYHQGRFHNRKD